MAHTWSFRFPLCGKRRAFKYFVLCTVERKHSCKIFLAFRVPAPALAVDYTINDAGVLRDYGFCVEDGVVEQVGPVSFRRGPRRLEPEAARALDHYCERRMLCVLKRYHCPSDRTPANVAKRATSEIQALRRLGRAKGVVSMLETFEYDGALYCAMEYLWRGTLWHLIRRNNGLDLHTAKVYALQVAMAIGAIHRQGISHRDVTSSNVMITSAGSLKVIDFNLSKSLKNLDARMNSFVGTYNAMPPEVLHCHSGSALVSGDPYYTKEIDWWYFGALVYEMLTGQLPFHAGNEGAVAFYNKVISSPQSINLEAVEDPTARDLVERLMHGVPSERLGAVGGMAGVIKHPFFAGVRSSMRPISLPTDYIESRIFECIKVGSSFSRPRHGMQAMITGDSGV
ncbi:protein kinase domain-containing protein [Babesia caballi]|uniref:non-specific serine/threonine protein kinase n=1 Tax=Babesia caballi TaxID=5871 RepID=A0AAV4LR00_BABCB|nr:protein kinase domain-containing protein [Babesia caballi]